MRLTINTKKINPLALNDEMANLFKLLELLESDDNYTLEQCLSYLKIDMESFNKIKYFFIISDGVIKAGDMFAYTNKNNASNVAKYRSKAKVEALPTPQVKEAPEKPKKEKPVKVDEFDFEEINYVYNEVFKDTKVQKIKIIDEARQKALRALWKKYKLKEQDNPSEFFLEYYKLLYNKVGNGWKNAAGEQVNPTFDWLHKDKAYKMYMGV